MDIQEFIVDRDQHMRPLEYDLSENFNELLRYMRDMGVLDNVPVGTTSESEVVSISDAYPAQPRALSVYGKSTQDGTPTPDAPVPILSVDDLSLMLAGKNLIPTTMPDNAIHAQMSGATITSAGNAWVFALPCARNTDYYLSSATNGTIGVLGLSTSLPEVGGAYTRLTGMANYKNWAISTGENDYILIQVANTAQFDAIATNQGQLELGSTATAYEPYQGTTVPDLLPEGTSLRGLPDGTKDTLSLSYLRPSTRDGWAWYSREVVQRTNLVTFDGSENWAKDSHGWYNTRYDLHASSNYKNAMLCDCLQVFTRSTILDSVTGISGYEVNPVSAGNWIYINVQDVASTEAFKAWLVAHTPTVVYALKEANYVTTTIDPIELPTLPAPTATVWCDGGSATPTLVLEYVRDTNAAIADLSEAIADIVSG